MKRKRRSGLSLWLVLLVALVAFLAQPLLVSAAPTVTLSPTSISCDQPLILTITINNLSAPGKTVWIDLVGNTADSAAQAYVRFSVKDGTVAPKIGGITNKNVNGDEDGSTNSSIRTTLKLFDNPFPVGTFYVRITDSDNTSASSSFTITKTPTLYSISGTVRKNDGTAAEGAIVEVAGEDECRGCGAKADASGNYTLYVDNEGDYMVGAFKHGLISKGSEDGSSSYRETTVYGHTTGVDLVLFNPSNTISGTIRDAGTSQGIGGVQVEGECETPDASYESTVLTENDGTFSLPVLPGEWEVEVSGLHEKGYVGKLEDFSPIDTTGGDVGNLVASYPLATALVYGTVKDPSGNPVPGDGLVKGWATIGETTYEVHGNVQENGEYFLGIIAGTWYVGVDADDLRELCLELAPPQYQQITLQNGQTAINNITLLQAGAIEGTVRDENQSPVEGVSINAYAGNCWNTFIAEADTDENGHYTLAPIAPGTYYLYAHVENMGTCPEYLDAWYGSAGAGQCDQAQPVTVTAGQTTNANFNLVPAGGISGTVTDSHSNPLKGITVIAMDDVNIGTCMGEKVWSAETDDQGNYVVCGIPAGYDYVVRVLSTDYIRLVYDGLRLVDCDDATPVPVTKGGITPNINFHLMIKYGGDFDADGDVDGADLALEATMPEPDRIPLSEFAQNFGKS